MLEVGAQRPDRDAGAEHRVDADQRAVLAGRRGGALEPAGQHGQRGFVDLQLRQRRVVGERRLAEPGVVRLRHPQLHAVQSAAIAAGRLLGVGDPAPGGHQVELARGDQLLGAEAVPVQHLAGDQPGDGVQTGVRVRADVEAVLLGDPDRAHVVGEAPRADGAAFPARERSAHRHRADPGLAALADLDAGCFGDAGRVDDRRVRGVHRSAHPRSMGPTPPRRPAPARVVNHFAGRADSGRDGTHVAGASCVLARASTGQYRRWHGAAGRG